MKTKQGAILWLTGLPCSGKSTIANELEKYFQSEQMPVQKLDGDLLRATISKDLGFTPADRYKQCERVAYIAQMLSMHGINVVVALVSPYRHMRDRAKEICGNITEIHINCSQETCEKRDVKGMYKKALSGKINDFTGIQDIYEPPLNPDLTLDTEKNTVKECVSKVISFLKIDIAVFQEITLADIII